jgi:hypothetical protein
VLPLLTTLLWRVVVVDTTLLVLVELEVAVLVDF